MKYILLIVLSFVGFLGGFGGADPAHAGIGGTSLPTFSDGKPSIEVATVTGVIKRLRLESHFACTSIDTAPVDIGVQVFDAFGVLLNDVGSDVGVILGIAPGQTVTVGTSATAAYLESTTIPLPEIAQGSARILASSQAVRCRAWILDQALSPPVTIGDLPNAVHPAAGAAGLPLDLPTFANGTKATHSMVVPGVVKRGRLETNFFCTSTATGVVHIGVQIFGPDGVLRNDLGAGNGAVLDVPSGGTVTIGTTGTVAYLEDTVIRLDGVAQGYARIVASSSEIVCGAMLTESDSDPAVGLTSLRPQVLVREIPTDPPTSTPTQTSTPTHTVPPTSTFTPRPTNTPAPTFTPIVGCTGDCDGDGAVRIAELISGVRIALGRASLDDCTSFDENGDGELAISELIRAVNVALNGCIAP